MLGIVRVCQPAFTHSLDYTLRAILQNITTDDRIRCVLLSSLHQLADHIRVEGTKSFQILLMAYGRIILGLLEAHLKNICCIITLHTLHRGLTWHRGLTRAGWTWSGVGLLPYSLLNRFLVGRICWLLCWNSHRGRRCPRWNFNWKQAICLTSREKIKEISIDCRVRCSGFLR